MPALTALTLTPSIPLSLRESGRKSSFLGTPQTLAGA
jgi:hypothetical protein